MSLNHLANDEVILIKDGEEYGTIQCQVGEDKIIVPDESIPIEKGDYLIRELPSGIKEGYVVEDPNFTQGPSGSRMSHYSLKVSKVDPDAIKDESKNHQIERDLPKDLDPNSIFLIHGHDEANKLKLKELLRERWDIETIILQREPGKGRTLIEKFEEEAQNASFGFALLTPDDFVESEMDSEGENYAQPRPNVIFELGWFYGRLGRDRVCILLKEGTELHSDLRGISQIRFSSEVNEKIQEIERELEAADIL